MICNKFIAAMLSLQLVLAYSLNIFHNIRPREELKNSYLDGDHAEALYRQLAFSKNNESLPNLVTMSIFGETQLGYYYTTVFVGNPPQRETLIVDTGSGITTFPCEACGSNCGTDHLNARFTPGSSYTSGMTQCGKTYDHFSCNHCEAEGCGFYIGYTEGSTLTGKYVTDDIRFGLEIEKLYAHQSKLSTENQIQLAEDYKVFGVIGCTTKETNLFYTQAADGILGLGSGTNTGNSPPNIVDYTNDEAAWAFSICFAHKGGYLTLGGYNTTYHDPTDHIHWVQKSIPHTYRIIVSEIKVGDQSLSGIGINYGNALVDSGTTLFYGPSSIIKAMDDSIKRFCSLNNSHCGGSQMESNRCFVINQNKHKSLSDYFATFPPLNFNLSGEIYTWEPSAYLHLGGKKEYCLLFQSFHGDSFIFGGVFMKNHDIIFDKKQDKIGFIKANCGAMLKQSEEYYSGYSPIDFVSLNYSNGTAIVEPITIARNGIQDYIWIIITGAALLGVLISLAIYYVKQNRLKRSVQQNQDYEQYNNVLEGVGGAATALKVIYHPALHAVVSDELNSSRNFFEDGEPIKPTSKRELFGI
jgi:hypothetical protein